MTKDHYFFFDADGMPIAVFLTEVKYEAIHLFVRLYRRPWDQSLKMGFTVEKESDVPAERWEEIHERYIARVKPRPTAQVLVARPAATMIRNRKPDEYQTSGLETAKYMSRM